MQFVDFIAWGKTGENIVEYCKTGDQIAIEGETVKGTYEVSPNVKVSRQEIRVVNVSFIGPKEITLDSELPENFKMARDEERIEDIEE